MWSIRYFVQPYSTASHFHPGGPYIYLSREGPWFESWKPLQWSRGLLNKRQSKKYEKSNSLSLPLSVYILRSFPSSHYSDPFSDPLSPSSPSVFAATMISSSKIKSVDFYRSDLTSSQFSDPLEGSQLQRKSDSAFISCLVPETLFRNRTRCVSLRFWCSSHLYLLWSFHDFASLYLYVSSFSDCENVYHLDKERACKDAGIVW